MQLNALMAKPKLLKAKILAAYPSGIYKIILLLALLGVGGFSAAVLSSQNSRTEHLLTSILPLENWSAIAHNLAASESDAFAKNRSSLTIPVIFEEPVRPPHAVWIVGDSLTHGLFASSEANTFRERLFGKIKDAYPGQIRNTYWVGICTLAKFESRWSGWPGSPDILFIELGINDVTQNRGCPQIPQEDWPQHYGQMLDRIRADAPGVKIVVGTVPWCNWPEESAEYRRALLFNQWITAEAEKRGIPVADLWGSTVGRKDGISSPDTPSVFPARFHGDTFHPSDAGHERIANTFFEAYRQAWLDAK